MTVSAVQYHYKTSYRRHETDGRGLDWSNQPELYKNYPETDRLELPPPVSGFSETLSDICRKSPAGRLRENLSIRSVSRILFTAYRITAKTPFRSGYYYYRSVPSAGALYPCELYFSSRSVAGLEDGLYHYDIRSHSVVRIRRGSGFTLMHPDHDAPELTFFISAVFFRSSWKYRDRSYRYHLLDTGHLLETIVLTLKAASLPYLSHYDFDDAAVNEMLGLDANREVCLAIVKVSDHPAIRTPDASDSERLPEPYYLASRMADHETACPVVSDIHAESSVILPHDFSSAPMVETVGPAASFSTDIRPPGNVSEILNFSEAIRRRRSLRNFIPSEISSDHWKTLLGYLIPEGVPEAEQTLFSASICIGCIAVRAEGLPPGGYLLHPDTRKIGMFQQGDRGNLTAHICLGQEWISNAGLHVFFAVNLKALEESFGARGYRYAMMNAGRSGQRLYLGAASLGLGCCGIGAFYDAEAASLLELGSDSVMIYLLSAGNVKKNYFG